MAQQDKTLDQQMLADEIGKYLIDKTRCRALPEMMDLVIKEENNGFVPTVLREFIIDTDSIEESSSPSRGTGVVTFKDMASDIAQNQDVTFRGLAETAEVNSRLFVGNVKIEWMYPLYPIAISDSVK
ncbi:hypothetical protein [uncultured Duncaniella sp.]|uniref:hypothetical protein n=1 Tax=uncultured Duncaniella sp. TaxID=2768039 RepID=UPI0025FEC875|nr:hypothetical protein [uncultured Duncaniella sp.]